jgi:hypothetical protein
MAHLVFNPVAGHGNAEEELAMIYATWTFSSPWHMLLFTQQLIKCIIKIDGKKSELSVGASTSATVAPPTLVSAQGFGKVIPDKGFLLDLAIAAAENKLSELESMAFLLASLAVV